MLIQETMVNKTENHLIYVGEPYEPFTDKIGELFNSLKKEYGRCTGKVYVGEGTQVGWVFEKREKYTDCNKTYLKETWVSLRDDLTQ